MIIKRFCSELSVPTVSGCGAAVPLLAAGRFAAVDWKFRPNLKFVGRRVGGYGGVSVGLVVAASPMVGFFAAPAPNMALNLAPFGRWTLRDKAAQRRLALR